MRKILDRIERAWRPHAIPNVTQGLVLGQVLPFVLSLSDQVDLGVIALIPGKVLEGEVWRLVTFLLYPPVAHPIFALIAWYVFWLMGTALEDRWGTARYNIYLFVAWLATIGSSFLVPVFVGQFGWLMPSTNAYIGLSVFLAFAYLFPNFEFLLFFLLPVKVKWLALISWVFIAFQVVLGSWVTRMTALASIANFLLFFGDDILLSMRAGHKKMGRKLENMREEERVYHRCTVCGVTERDDPQMDFRYCSSCEGDREYCSEHLRSHEHVTTPED